MGNFVAHLEKVHKFPNIQKEEKSKLDKPSIRKKTVRKRKVSMDLVKVETKPTFDQPIVTVDEAQTNNETSDRRSSARCKIKVEPIDNLSDHLIEYLDDKFVPKRLRSQSMDECLSFLNSTELIQFEDGEVKIDANTNHVALLQKSLSLQISNQIGAMLKKEFLYGMKNHESVVISIKGQCANVKVARTKGDGHCLYRALAHQLFREEMHSLQQDQTVTKLRRDVIAYIRENAQKFEYELKNIAFDRKENDENFNLNDECAKVLKDHFSNEFFWGGQETIKAVALIHNVNIIILNEEESCYMGNGFSFENDRSIIVAYRLAEDNSEQKRNHYDSVVDIDSNLIVGGGLVEALTLSLTISNKCHQFGKFSLIQHILALNLNVTHSRMTYIYTYIQNTLSNA